MKYELMEIESTIIFFNKAKKIMDKINKTFPNLETKQFWYEKNMVSFQLSPLPETCKTLQEYYKSAKYASEDLKAEFGDIINYDGYGTIKVSIKS